jgi:hypothetical protein
VTKRLQLAAELMRTNTSFHPDQARRHVGQPSIDLAARPLLPQQNRAAVI